MSQAIDLGAVRAGFTDPVLEAQGLFRRILDALARPGTLQDLSAAPEPPQGLLRPTGGIVLTLLDFETPVWLQQSLRGGETEAWLRFHCGCPLTQRPWQAAFALTTGSGVPPLTDFNPGDARYPDRSTTVVIQLPSLTGGAPVELQGPGIPGRITVSPDGLEPDFWSQIAENGCEFQLGVDVLLTDHTAILGLPRTVRLAAADQSNH